MTYRVVLALFVVTLSACASAQESVRPLTLAEAIRIARENHPLLAEGRAGVVIQQGTETQVRSPELPQINLQSTYSRANSRGSAFGASSAFTVYNTNVSLSQLVTDFGRTREKVKAAHLGVVSAQETLQSTLQQVLFNVYQAYDQLLEADAAVGVQKENVRNLEIHLKQAEAFFNVGTQPKIDVTQAEVNLSNGRLALVQAQNTFAISQTNLKAAMGKPDFPAVVAADKFSEPVFTITLDQAVKTGKF